MILLYYYNIISLRIRERRITYRYCKKYSRSADISKILRSPEITGHAFTAFIALRIVSAINTLCFCNWPLYPLFFQCACVRCSTRDTVRIVRFPRDCQHTGASTSRIAGPSYYYDILNRHRAYLDRRNYYGHCTDTGWSNSHQHNRSRNDMC